MRCLLCFGYCCLIDVLGVSLNCWSNLVDIRRICVLRIPSSVKSHLLCTVWCKLERYGFPSFMHFEEGKVTGVFSCVTAPCHLLYAKCGSVCSRFFYFVKGCKDIIIYHIFVWFIFRNNINCDMA